MHGVLRMVSGSRKNETAATPNYAPRSFFSPNFKEEDTMASIRAENWVQDSTFSEGIIPTGAESLARIEHKVNQNVNVKILEASQNAEAAKYFKMVESLAPNDLLMKFAKTAPKNVQEAAKSTIMNILGSLPNYALDAALITTNTKLANLLYQMQMTGYMFKNAEYRMSLTRGLKG